MYPSQFEYATATSLDEVIGLLQHHGDDARLLAGGHSLLPLMKLRLAAPVILVDLGRVRDLAGIQRQNGHLRIGALTTYADVLASTDVARGSPLLAEVADHIGDVQVRNRGTVGGSAAHADPAGDMPAALLALDASFTLRGPAGERTVPAVDFFQGPFTTALQPDEVLTSVVIPALPARTGVAYEKFRNPASGYAIVGVAAVVTTSEDGVIAEARLALTGAGSQPARMTAVEDAIRGQNPSGDTIRAAAEHSTDGIDIIGDLSGSPEYRTHLARVHTRRALHRALRNP